MCLQCDVAQISSLNILHNMMIDHLFYYRFCFVVSVEMQPQLYTLYPGDRLDLSCSTKDSLHAVNWTKDHVAMVDGEHTRIRNGQLEIEAVELTDSGLYTCVTLGNHSIYFNVTGKVTQTNVRKK